MTQEEKSLLHKDLSGRLPYRVKGWAGRKEILANISDRGFYQHINRDGWHPIEEFKPYLRRLSSMTEEEKVEFDKLMNLVEERCINAFGKGGYTLAFTDLNDWLDKHMFDYRGLIDKDLAIEASEGMYNI